jgi:aspartate/methionine/tyrosine aminotransferase
VTITAQPCPCGHTSCRDWHVQGVGFTEHEARVVAAVLSGTAVVVLCDDAYDAMTTAEAINYATPHINKATIVNQE